MRMVIIYIALFFIYLINSNEAGKENESQNQINEKSEIIIDEIMAKSRKKPKNSSSHLNKKYRIQ